METAAKPGAIILVSAHKLLRQALFLLGVKYVSVRPPRDSKTKQIYLAREVSPPPLRRDLFPAQPILHALRACVLGSLTLNSCWYTGKETP